MSQTSPSFQVAQAFGSNGVALDSVGQLLQAGSTVSTTISGVAATATVRSVTATTDWLSVIADGSVTINVPDRGDRVTLGVVTAIYAFTEPDTVNVVTANVFTSNVTDGEFIKVVVECSGGFVFQP